MDEFVSGLACGGLFVCLPTIGLAIAALVSAMRTRSALERVQRGLAELQGQVLSGSAAPPPAAAAAAAPAAPPPRPAPASPPAPPFDLGRFIERGAVWAFAGLGGLLLVIAVLFGLREAIAAGWFGPVARFAGAVFVGLMAWLVGELLRWRNYPTPAAALSGAGAAILYAALFAAHSRWGLVGQTVTFVSMAGVSTVAMLLAERRDSRFVALLAMLGGYATPLLLSTGENRAVAFFAYIALLDAGLLVVARRRNWPEFVAASGLATVVLYLGWTFSFRAPDQVAVGFTAALVLAGMYLASARGGETWKEKAQSLAAVATALALWLAATLAFATPTDPLRYDPVSSTVLAWDLGNTAWIAAAWMVLGAALVPFLLRAWAPARIVGAGAVGVGMFAFVLSWVLAGEPRWEVVTAVSVAVASVGWLSGGGRGGGLLYLAVAGSTGLAALMEPVPAAWLAPLSVGLTAGALLGAWREGSRLPLVALAIVGVVPIFGGLLARIDDGEAGPLALSVVVAYFACAVLPLLVPRRNDLAGAASSALAPFTLAFPLFLLWREAMGREVDGVLPVLLGANALVGALVLARTSETARVEREVALLVAVTLAGVAIAVPLQLDRAWLTVGWALLVALLAWAHRKLKHPLFVVFATVLALAVAARLLVNPYALDYGRAGGLILFNWTLYTWGIPTVCLLVAARWFEVGWLKVGLRTAAVLTGFALVNLEVAHAFALDDQLSFRSEELGQEMVRSISWGLYGLLLILVGIRRRSRAVRIGGLAFAVAAAGKVFVVDMWSLAGFARVGAFGGLAITLLAAAVAFAWLARSDDAAEKSSTEPKA